MSDPCRDCREAWLDTAPGGAGEAAVCARHLASCPACAAWCRRAAAAAGLVGALAPRSAPPTLASAVANEVEPGSEARFARQVGGLAPRTAPAELEERLAAEAFYASFLGRLEELRAPGVLARLVSEELADPAAPVRRFAGSLERRPAPASLVERLSDLGRRPARGGLAPLVAAAAAALLLWIGLRGPRRDESPRYSFELRVADLSALDPFARELGAALGAVGGAVEPAPVTGRAEREERAR